MHATCSRLVWLDAGRGFLRDTSGRFDVMYSERLRMWVAIDWDNGWKARFTTRDGAQGWCAAALMDDLTEAA